MLKKPTLFRRIVLKIGEKFPDLSLLEAINTILLVIFSIFILGLLLLT